MVKNCLNCGDENPDDGIFCQNCGSTLDEKLDAPQKDVNIENKSSENNALNTSKFDSEENISNNKNIPNKKKSSNKKLIIAVVAVIAVIAVGAFALISFFGPTIVSEEIELTSAAYKLTYDSHVSKSYYIYSKSGKSPNKNAYILSYNGKLKIALDTKTVSQGEKLSEILDSYINGDNEHNATYDLELSAYDSNDNIIKTTYNPGVANDNWNIVTKKIDLLFLPNLISSPASDILLNDASFKNNILTIALKGKGDEIGDEGFSSKIHKMDHINGVLNIYSKHLTQDDAGFFNYTLNFTIPKNKISVKKS
ncbi:zinc ribbon domain-containing protein [Methanobrevibacter curvatus]|uniref:Zinc-ribbon domain-containing protein n=1 Tax=Methanobrevibacter curvatus TaxID=49547 RepID=A0A166CW46_9EURY|nr:zinc ribbon domain-containing protein [Methanobrevibacter curvatus]KZX14925.1 hypothetical protein MBCUR_03360 [Methanobrevibacter curvatus]